MANWCVSMLKHLLVFELKIYFPHSRWYISDTYTLAMIYTAQMY